MYKICTVILMIMSMFFTLNLTMCTVEFRGYTNDGQKLVHYEFARSHVEWGPKDVFVRTNKKEIVTEKNVECDADGWCCHDGTKSGYDCGYAWDCNGHQAFVTYEWREDVYRKEMKLVGGRTIKGEEYYKETESIIDQAECIQDE